MTTSNPTLTSSGPFKPIFTGGKSLFGLRVLSVLAVVIWYVGMSLAYDIYTSHGLNPADGYGGQLAPASHRLGISVPLAIFISVVFFFAIFMAHKVVTKILLSEDRETLRIKTMGVWKWGQLDIPRNDLLCVTEENHRSGASTVTVPRLRLQLKDRTWALWMQMPGNVSDEKAFRKYILSRRGGR